MVEVRHYTTHRGRCPVREFIEEMPQDAQYELLAILRRLEQGETLHMPLVRSLSSVAHGLWEMRIRDREGHHRIFYYAGVSGVIYLLHALRKKTRTILLRDRNLIMKRVREINGAR